MTFNRKGIGELEAAVDEGKVDIVLVKDLSRLGRHRTQTALFIDHLRENNVKVYSVTEGIDTTDENDDLLIGFKQIFNDFYAKDISKKVRTGVRQKQKNTGLVETLPLGYIKDKNTGKVIIDEETAWIVREVFKLYVEGYGLTTIARKMNADGIRSPDYYFKRKLSDSKPEISKKYLWVQTAVKRILTNELYIGVLVNHKTVTSKIYKTKTFVPTEEQYRHENFCEPIIDETTWNQAQFLLEQRAKINPRSSGGRKLHRYSGIIKCAECGAILIAKRRIFRGHDYVEYTCNSHHRYGKEYCTPHRIHEDQLDEIIRDEIVFLRERVMAESEEYDQIIKEWIKHKPQYEQRIKQYNDRIIILKNQIEELIIERINDREHAQLYNEMIAKREQEVSELQLKIAQSKEYDEFSRRRRDELKSTAEMLEDILEQPNISDSNMRLLVKRIFVHQNNDKSLDVKLEFNGDWLPTCTVYIDTEDEEEQNSP